MMDPVTGATALGLLGKAVDTIGKLNKVSQDAAINEKAIELHGLIISLQSEILRIQSEYGDLLQIKNNLEQKLVDKDQWSKTAEQYELVDIASGTMMYMLKPNYQASQPGHYLCPVCYEREKKSFVHKDNVGGVTTSFKCNECKSEWSPRNNHLRPELKI